LEDFSKTTTLGNWSADIALKMTNFCCGWCRLVGMVILVQCRQDLPILILEGWPTKDDAHRAKVQLK